MDFEPTTIETTARAFPRPRLAAEKVWNVELPFSPAPVALPQDVQDAVARDYGHTQRPERVLHKGVVYLAADAHGSMNDHAARCAFPKRPMTTFRPSSICASTKSAHH